MNNELLLETLLKYTFNPNYYLDLYLLLGGYLKCHCSKWNNTSEGEDERHLYNSIYSFSNNMGSGELCICIGL